MAYNIQDTMYHQDQVTIVKEYEVFVRETFIQENSKGNICPVNPSRCMLKQNSNTDTILWKRSVL